MFTLYFAGKYGTLINKTKFIWLTNQPNFDISSSETFVLLIIGVFEYGLKQSVSCILRCDYIMLTFIYMLPNKQVTPLLCSGRIRIL